MVLKVVKAAAMAMALLAPSFAHASDYPSRPIKLFVGFSAGGGTDTIARVYGETISKLIGAPVVVENRPGAHQLLAINPVTSAEPDGYSLFLGVASSLSSGPAIRDDLGYEPLESFELLGLASLAPGVFFVSPALGINSFDELLAYAKANPGKLNYGSAGVGASNHLLMEFVKSETGLDATHIPFASDQEVVREVIAGNVDVAVVIAQAALPVLGSGDVIPVALAGAEPLAQYPEIPLLSDTGFAGLQSVKAYSFYGFVGPKGMPAEVVAKLNGMINQASEDEILKKRLADMAFVATTSTVDSFKEFLEVDSARWRDLASVVKLH